MEQKRNLRVGRKYQLSNGCNWCDLPKDLPPYSTASGTINIGEHKECYSGIRDVLHGQVRQQVKKNLSGQP